MAPLKGDELQGKVALVTGGSRNIGRGIAEALAAGGASVMVNASRDEEGCRETVALIQQTGGTAAHYMADVTDEDAVQAMVDATVARFGRLDLLSTNQTLRASHAIESMTYEDFRKVVTVILDGAFLCARAVVPHMLEAGGGAIVFTGGQTGVTGARRASHQSAAKSGLAGMTKALAMELADRHITVNCVHPWLIDTARVAPGDHARGGATPPIGRMGNVDEVSNLVRLLCGPQGSYITGQNIFINGGGYMP